MGDYIDTRRLIREAEEQRIAAVLANWQKDIEAAAAAAVERQADAARQATERAQQVAAQLRRQDAADLAAQLVEAAAAEARLYGIVLQAIAGYDISVSVPGGISVASTLINAANDAESTALFTELEQLEDQSFAAAQRSIAWAMDHGFVPHPKDLATLTKQFESNGDWAKHFGRLGRELDQLVASPHAPAMLQAVIGGRRLDVVKATVDALERYSPQRTHALVSRPSQLGTLGEARSVKDGAGSGRIAAPVLDQIIAGIFTPSRRS